MRLHIFNPENDMALAANVANYTPPKSVAQFKRRMAWLPLILANDGDNIWAPDIDRDLFRRKCDQFGVDAGLEAQGEPAPWGWSANAVEQFRRIGITGPFPDCDAIRRLSHRRTALLLHRALSSRLPYPLPPEPLEVTDLRMLPPGRDFFLKSPWSCSGRGVVDCRTLSDEQIRRRANDAIRRQGSVMLEAALPKRRDFAMLFTAKAGRVQYQGLSLFHNKASVAYAGNIIAPEESLREQLAAPHFDETQTAVAQALEQIIGNDYEGPLGVDMMLYGRENLICPTVEVNLRTTMGFVAMALARRGICEIDIFA